MKLARHTLSWQLHFRLSHQQQPSGHGALDERIVIVQTETAGSRMLTIMQGVGRGTDVSSNVAPHIACLSRRCKGQRTLCKTQRYT